MQKRQKLICMILILLLSSLVFTTCDMTYEQESDPHYFKPIVIEAKSIPSSSVDSIDDPPLKSDVLTRENPSTQTRELPTLTATHLLMASLAIGLFNLTLAIGYVLIRLLQKSRLSFKK